MLEGLLKEQIQGDEQIEGMLTSYNGKPAFFYQKSPSDVDGGWERDCYPRADYNIDMQYNPERKINGILTINIWCSSQSEAMPEDIEKRLRELIEGTFYGSRQASVCAAWNRSDAFAFESNANINNCEQPEIFGVTMIFELMEFPLQITTDPDPIQGINQWTKNNFPNLTVIAHDTPPQIWKPTEEQPAVYWRFVGSDTDDKQSYTVTWYMGEFAAHVIMDNVVERNRLLKAIAEKLQVDGEIILPDDSPMFIKRIQIRHDSDPLREGQLTLSGRYGVLSQQRKESAEIKLNRANYNCGGEEMAKITVKTETEKGTAKTETAKNNTASCKAKTSVKNTGIYSASELAAESRKLFGTAPEIVTAALKERGKRELTLEEAKDIVNKFLSREVK